MEKRVYVWEFPVRLTHWVNFLSILALSITGFYIGAPFLHAIRENQFIMAQMRFIHFVSAYVFTVSFLIRIYWLFMGNQYSRLNQFIFVSGERWKNLIDTALFYAFLKKDLPHSPGHTGIAGLTYFIMFLIFLLEIFTGFALYSESHLPGFIWTFMGGWLFSIMGTGTVRLIHHLLMWVIGVFTIVHVYVSWHNDVIEKNGLMSSIFSGYKSIEE
ncbi:MAG: Ni/Fe-hydrogenase, b-type cytochrome subunit [Nitrospirae bacterium]|nr:Ni/Fe-hydrogenase, b-type cytochrome subunit [Nitrospirota bacterium]MCL5422702.1 Ni/Fe-hydrogenase, b-type cytochrome subunit [Nitrospirota bacterium]